jgi:hypothetical protein
MIWLGNKVAVCEIPHYEIVNILHQNQATILKDIQKEIYKTKENYYACLFEVYRNLLLGLD